MMTSKETQKQKKRAESLVANLKKYTKTRHPHMDFLIADDKDVGEWYIRIRDFDGDDGEFKSGEYIAKVKAPANYPFGPPEFYFHTPNGIYDTDKKVCIDIGEFHKDNYPAALGMGGFSVQLLNGIIGWRSLGDGIAILHTTVGEKRKLAITSKNWNRKNLGALVKRFETLPHNVMYDRIDRLPLSTRVKRSLCRWLGLAE